LCLKLVAWRLVLGSWRLGACSFWPLIRIRGPCLAHPLLMIFKSSAMVESCGPEACLTSIVNCFIYPLLLALVLECLPGPVDDFTNLLHREIIKRGQITSYIILHSLSSCLELEACSFFLFLIFS